MLQVKLCIGIPSRRQGVQAWPLRPQPRRRELENASARPIPRASNLRVSAVEADKFKGCGLLFIEEFWGEAILETSARLHRVLGGGQEDRPLDRVGPLADQAKGRDPGFRPASSEADLSRSVALVFRGVLSLATRRRRRTSARTLAVLPTAQGLGARRSLAQ